MEGEALEENEDENPGETKKKIISFVIRSENDGKIKAMVNQARNQPEITFSESDMNPYLLNVINGTLDLKTGKLREHKKSDYITRIIDVEYDQNAECPNWIRFLGKIFMGDYADTLKASSLMARQYDDGARGDIAKLAGKRFVVSSELNEDQYFDESLIKCITGGEVVSVRFLYGEEFDFKSEGWVPMKSPK